MKTNLVEKWSETGLLEPFETKEHKAVAAAVYENLTTAMFNLPEKSKSITSIDINCLFPIACRTLVTVLKFSKENDIKVTVNEYSEHTAVETTLMDFPSVEEVGKKYIDEVEYVTEASKRLSEFYLDELKNSSELSFDNLILVKVDDEGNKSYVTNSFIL